MSRVRLLQALAVTGAAVTVTMFSLTSASAAPVIKPSPSCKVPVMSVSQTSAMPGTKVTVSGVNFSGCSAQGNPAKATAVLTVKVGVVTATKASELLATTTTTKTGSFSVQITVPKVPAGGATKIALAAEATDPVTKLSYIGAAAITYSVPTTPPTTTASPTSATTSSSAEPTMTSSTVELPTAVPAGSGGFGAPTSAAQLAAEIGLGGAGVALLAVGGIGLGRRRGRQH